MKKEKFRLRALWAQIREDKRAFTVYIILHTAVLAILVRSLFLRRFENAFTAVLALLLLLIPPIVEKSLSLKLPTTLEILAYVFVFSAEILGEIGNFYVQFRFWDTMLHTVNGFMFAAFGFCLVDILNKSGKFRLALSPAFLALVAFCFSMTIGTMWEFFEFGADNILGTDMQKDRFITEINTVSLPNEEGEKVTHVTGIEEGIIVTKDGEVIRTEGYLDVGLYDTMKDLFVNLIGAAVFSIIGYFYVKHRGKGRIANRFIPVFVGEESPPSTD